MTDVCVKLILLTLIYLLVFAISLEGGVKLNSVTLKIDFFLN